MTELLELSWMTDCNRPHRELQSCTKKALNAMWWTTQVWRQKIRVSLKTKKSPSCYNYPKLHKNSRKLTGSICSSDLSLQLVTEDGRKSWVQAKYSGKLLSVFLSPKKTFLNYHCQVDTCVTVFHWVPTHTSGSMMPLHNVEMCWWHIVCTCYRENQ